MSELALAVILEIHFFLALFQSRANCPQLIVAFVADEFNFDIERQICIDYSSFGTVCIQAIESLTLILHFIIAISRLAVVVAIASMYARREAEFTRFHHINVGARGIVLHGLLAARISVGIVSNVKTGDASALHMTQVDVELDMSALEPRSECVANAIPF